MLLHIYCVRFTEKINMVAKDSTADLNKRHTNIWPNYKVKKHTRVTKARTTDVQYKLTKGRALEVKLAMGI